MLHKLGTYFRYKMIHFRDVLEKSFSIEFTEAINPNLQYKLISSRSSVFSTVGCEKLIKKYIRINFNAYLECQWTRTVFILNTNSDCLQFYSDISYGSTCNHFFVNDVLEKRNFLTISVCTVSCIHMYIPTIWIDYTCLQMAVNRNFEIWRVGELRKRRRNMRYEEKRIIWRNKTDMKFQGEGGMGTGRAGWGLVAAGAEWG